MESAVWGNSKLTMEIRLAKPEEALELATLILSMAWESEQRVLNPETLQAGIQAVFHDPSLGEYWVLADENRLIGCTMITVEWSDWHNAPYWWIQSLYLLPEFRGIGWFERLLSVLEQSARAKQVQELRLYVETHNGRALRVYQRNGFESGHYHCMTKTL